MSSDEDADITRLRSDLIKSIRSKKSSRASPLSTSTRTTNRSGKQSRINMAIPDTDMDDLEALRRAALVTLKKSKDTSVAQVASSAPATSGSPSVANQSAMSFPPGPVGFPFSSNQFYVPPPVLLGPSASFSQFPAPPPAYQSRFFNHNAIGLRSMLQQPRSNLIVIQPMPRPEDNPREQPSTFSSGKLILPQDRYLRRDKDADSGSAKRKRDDKWSRFEDSSSSSSSSDNSPVSSDTESDDDIEPEVSGKNSEDGAGDRTPCEDDEKKAPLSDSAESTRYTHFEGMVVDESISEEHSEDEPEKESETGLSKQNEHLSARSETPPQQGHPSSSSASEEEDALLLEEPEEIEFLDEPVDEEIMQQFMMDSPALSDPVSTPELVIQQTDEDASMKSLVCKELKKQQLKSEYDALKQQLDDLRQRKATSSKHRVSDASDARKSHKMHRYYDRRSRSRSADRAIESTSKRSRREEDGQGRRNRSPDQKPVLSSVVALTSRPMSSGRTRREDHRETNKDISRGYDSDSKPKRHRDHASDDDSGVAFAKEPHRPVRNADSDDALGNRRPIGLPSASEDLRKFLEKKKDRSGFTTALVPGDGPLKVDLTTEDAGPSRPTGKVISLKKTSSTFVDKLESRIRVNGTMNCGGPVDQRDTVVSKPSIKDRLVLPRDTISTKSMTDTSKFTKRRYEMDPNDADESDRTSGSHASSRLGGRWRNFGAASNEGTNGAGFGQKVKLRKRPY